MAGDNENNENNDDENPLYDPFDEDGPFSEAALMNLISDQNPNLMDLSNDEPNPPPPPPPPTASVTDTNETQLFQDQSLSIPNSDANNEFLDEDFTLSWDMFEGILNDNNLPGEIGNGNDGVGNGETYRLEPSNRVFIGENGANFETGGPSTPPVSVTPPASDGLVLCTCCNLLRQIVHSNGPETMRLNIHGGIGYFCHAILEIERLGETIERRYQTFHLRGLDMEGVKAFIEKYCLDRNLAGWTLTRDANSSFYQAVNAGSLQKPLYVLITIPPPDDNNPQTSLAEPNQALNVPSLPNQEVNVPSLPNQAPNVPSLPVNAGIREEEARPLRERRLQTPLAIQRERLRNLTLKHVSDYFSLPLEEAARKIDVCPTVVKKICRKGGLLRWPHRKIKSLQRKIDALKSVLRTAKDPGVRARTEAEIEKLEKQISEICSEILKNFQSLLHEACGRIVNPIYGSVGLLWSGSWQLCQAAVDAVLKGEPITSIATDTAENGQGPSLKVYDIRHISKEENSAANGSSHRKPYKTRRAKRASLGSIVPEEKSSGDGEASHDSSLSHQSEVVAVHDGKEAANFPVELELKLGIEPVLSRAEHDVVPVKKRRMGVFRTCQVEEDTCKEE